MVSWVVPTTEQLSFSLQKKYELFTSVQLNHAM
jgi:hypothetical protein